TRERSNVSSGDTSPQREPTEREPVISRKLPPRMDATGTAPRSPAKRSRREPLSAVLEDDPEKTSRYLRKIGSRMLRVGILVFVLSLIGAQNRLIMAAGSGAPAIGIALALTGIILLNLARLAQENRALQRWLNRYLVGALAVAAALSLMATPLFGK